MRIKVWRMYKYIYLETINWQKLDKKIAIIIKPRSYTKIATWPRASE